MSTRILLVEPSRTQAQIVSMILADAGYAVENAATTDAAMQQFADRPADGVIVNYTLPDGSGSSLCEKLKSVDRDTCVLVMAESGGAHQILESLAAGADGFCIKTADMTHLADQLGRSLKHARSGNRVLAETVEFQGREYRISLSVRQWLDVLVATLDDLSELRERCRDQSGELVAFRTASDHNTDHSAAASGVPGLTGDDCPDAPADSPPDDRPIATVILAEDSATNRILGMSLLETSGYRVLVATDGHEVLAHLEASDHKDIAFVLMDVEMPGMDGLEATRRIRAEEADSGERVPILAMTAHFGDHERQQCFDAGMDACLEKPLRIPAVMEALSGLRAQPDSGRRSQRTLTAVDDDVSTNTPITATGSIVDWDAAMAAVCGEPNLLQAVIEAVFQEWPTRKTDLEQSIAAEDTELLKRTAHSIAGLLRTFQPEHSRDSASDLAHRIEKQSGLSDAATLAPLATRLCDEFALFIAELQTWMEQRN